MPRVNDDDLDEVSNSSITSILSYGLRPPGVKEHSVGVGGGSLILINTVVGGGISLVATPYAAKCLGLGAFLGAELVFGIMSTISLVMLGRVCSAANSFNLKYLAETLIGKWAGVFISMAIALNNFFVVIAFIQIGFDVCDALFNDTVSPFVIAGVTLLTLPIANFAHIDSIEPLALVCTVLWMAFVVLIMVNFFVAYHKGHLATESEWEWSASLIDVFLGKGLPAINLTWTCQFNAAPLFGSLTPCTRKSMSHVGTIMSVAAVGLYMTYGLGTYRYYGSNIQDDIMKSINPDKDGKGLEWGEWSVKLAEALLGTSAMGTIPFFLIESRNMAHETFTSKELGYKARLVETAAMLAIAYGVAILASDLSIIIALIGVFPANLIAWILPGLLVICLSRRTDDFLANAATLASDTVAPPPPTFPKNSHYYGYALLAWASILAPLGLISMFR